MARTISTSGAPCPVRFSNHQRHATSTPFRPIVRQIAIAPTLSTGASSHANDVTPNIRATEHCDTLIPTFFHTQFVGRSTMNMPRSNINKLRPHATSLVSAALQAYEILGQRISTPSGHEISKSVTFLLCFSGTTHMDMVLP